MLSDRAPCKAPENGPTFGLIIVLLTIPCGGHGKAPSIGPCSSPGTHVHVETQKPHASFATQSYGSVSLHSSVSHGQVAFDGAAGGGRSGVHFWSERALGV